MNKQEIRKKIKTKLDKMSLEDYWNNCFEIHKKLFNHAAWKNSSIVAITVSRGKEIDTASIIKQAWKEKKQIAVPKCDPATNTMEFRVISTFEQLEEGYFGILEPIVTETKVITSKEIELMIVPGVAYDFNGYRIGYGGGYYDRYLSNYHNKFLSLAFTQQFVNHIPAKSFDIAIPIIITEKSVFTWN